MIRCAITAKLINLHLCFCQSMLNMETYSVGFLNKQWRPIRICTVRHTLYILLFYIFFKARLVVWAKKKFKFSRICVIKIFVRYRLISLFH